MLLIIINFLSVQCILIIKLVNNTCQRVINAIVFMRMIARVIQSHELLFYCLKLQYTKIRDRS